MAIRKQDTAIESSVVDVIGTDAAGIAALPPRWRRLLRQAHLVAAPRRLLPHLNLWLDENPETSPHGGEGTNKTRATLVASDALSELLPRLHLSLRANQHVVLLASGDPLWFGIGRFLLEHLPAERLRFHPAPSSLQLAFARIGRPWQDASWVSLHGRDPEPLAAELQKRPPALVVLTDPGKGGAEAVRRSLSASGLEQTYRLWLCERLGHTDERVQTLAPGHPLPADLDPLHLVVLLAEPAPSPDPEQLPPFGIEDGLWLQHSDRPGLMTKREVRVQLLADLKLPAHGVLWDIGAGVGSIGVEALRLRPALALWAVERRSGGKALIEANAERMGVHPTGVLEGEAPTVLGQLPDPDRVVIGGGGRDRLAVLLAVLERLRPAGIVVIPLATLESVAELRPALESAGLLVAVSQLQAWRGVPLADGTRLAPLNPVLVLQGRRP